MPVYYVNRLNILKSDLQIVISRNQFEPCVAEILLPGQLYVCIAYKESRFQISLNAEI